MDNFLEFIDVHMSSWVPYPPAPRSRRDLRFRQRNKAGHSSTVDRKGDKTS